MKSDRILQLDHIHMRSAFDYASMSRAIRKKTGAVITKGENIISYGWNGMPANSEDDCCELKDENGEFILTPEGEMITNPLVLHGEANAILKLSAYGGIGAEGATLYCTMSPCIDCTKLILQSKIKKVIYYEQYRIPQGISILLKYGIIVKQHLGDINEQTYKIRSDI